MMGRWCWRGVAWRGQKSRWIVCPSCFQRPDPFRDTFAPSPWPAPPDSALPREIGSTDSERCKPAASSFADRRFKGSLSSEPSLPSLLALPLSPRLGDQKSLTTRALSPRELSKYTLVSFRIPDIF